MIELFTALGMSELGAYIVSLGSPIICIAALVVVCIMSIYKITAAVKDLRNTDELKRLANALDRAHVDNESLRKLNKKLIQELSRKIDLEGFDDEGK